MRVGGCPELGDEVGVGLFVVDTHFVEQAASRLEVSAVTGQPNSNDRDR